MERFLHLEWGAAGLGGLLDAAPDAMVVIDPGGNVLLFNAQAEKLFGYTREEIAGENVDILVPAGLRSVHQKHRDAYVAEPHVREMGSNLELLASRKDGSEFPVEISLSPTLTPNGPVISATIRDVTNKRDQERLFRGLLEAAPDAMVIVDSAGSIVLVNAQVEELFGYERAELIGQPVEVLVPDRFAAHHTGFRHGYVRGPRTRPMGLAGDLYARRKDNTEFPVEISLAPLETPDGMLVSAAVRDISERKRLQVAADRARDEYFATVSHELRTPLTSMLGYAELLSDLEELSPEGKRFLDVISRSAARELRLVNDLLTLVNIEQSGLSYQRRTIDLASIVRDSLETARPDIEEAGLELSLRLPDGPVVLSGDRDRIGQAVDNLVSNAIKFSPRGGSIRVDLVLVGDWARLDVRDSGAGLGDADPDRLFERLYRAPSAVRSQIPGAGLGLPIARAILEHHGGGVRVSESGPDGTTFTIELPLLKDTPPAS